MSNPIKKVVIFLLIFLLYSCLHMTFTEENGVRIGLKEESGDFADNLLLLYGLESFQITDTEYFIKKGPALDNFLQIADRLPCIHKINGIMCSPHQKKGKTTRISVKFRKNTKEKLKIAFFSFFGLLKMKYLDVIDTYTFQLPEADDAVFLISHIQSFSFIIHVEEDFEVKMF